MHNQAAAAAALRHLLFMTQHVTLYKELMIARVAAATAIAEYKDSFIRGQVTEISSLTRVQPPLSHFMEISGIVVFCKASE